MKKGFLNVKNIKFSRFLMLKQNLVNEAISFSNNLENFGTGREIYCFSSNLHPICGSNLIGSKMRGRKRQLR